MTRTDITTALAVAGILLPVSAFAGLNSVKPYVQDANGLPNLVFAGWLSALGCPADNTNFPTDLPPDSTGIVPAYACTPPVDLDDPTNEGLLLSKQGPTATNGQAGAWLNGVQGMVVTDPTAEIGFDLRKNHDPAFPGGSHCSENSPRIEIVTTGPLGDTTHLYQCSTGWTALPESLAFATLGWTRLRWMLADGGIAAGDTIKSAKIVLDDGQDGIPDFFGLAVLDNIFFVDSMVGMGESHPAAYSDEDNGYGEDGDHDSCQFRDSASHPERDSMRYSDKSHHMNLSGVGAMRAIAYTGTALTGGCVSFSGDAYVNGRSGYVYNFQACSVAGAKGNFTISVTGPSAFAYQKAGTFAAGAVNIHQ